MDLIQENGKPRYGRFESVPSTIHVQHYIYKTPYGKVLKGWRKQLKYKNLNSAAFNINTIVLVWQLQISAGSGMVFYIYDHETEQVIEWNAIQPLGHKTYLDEQPLFNQSYFSKSPYQFDIQHANGVRYIRVTKYGEIQLSARIFVLEPIY